MENPAESERTPNIGYRLKEQQHEQTNPVEKNRQPTDRHFMWIFLPISLAWLVITVFGIFIHYLSENGGRVRHYTLLLDFINAPLTTFNITLFISIFLSLIVIHVCLVFYRKLTKLAINIGSMIGIIALICNYFQILFQSMIPPSHSPIHDIILLQPLSGIYLLIYVLPIICMVVSFFKVDSKILCDITKDSCRLIQSNYSMQFFAIFISILLFLVFSFVLNAAYNVSDSESLIEWHILFYIIIVFGGIYVVSFILNFTSMVISEYSINYYWTKGKNYSVWQSGVKIFRNHAGTAMFASTPVIPFICSIIQAIKHKPSWPRKEHYFFYIITKIYLITTPDIALIFSSIYGSGFSKSYEKSFVAVLRRSVMYMAMLWVIGIVLGIIVSTLVILSVVIYLIDVKLSNYTVEVTDRNTVKVVSPIFFGCFYVFTVFALLIVSTMKSYLINKIIILNKEDDETEGNGKILDRLQ